MKFAMQIDDRWDEHRSRKAERLPFEAAVKLRPQGNASLLVAVQNLSAYGFMAETDAIIPIGGYVWLTLPGIGQANARIVWALAGRVGAEFVEPIDLARCQQAIAEAARTMP